MGLFIYKLNNDKNTEIKKSANLQAQVNSLTGTVSDLQGKINTISESNIRELNKYFFFYYKNNPNHKEKMKMK